MNRCLLTGGLAACMLMTAVAQVAKKSAPQAQEPASDDVMRISVRLVQVDGTVTDKDGRQVTDLNKDDFELFVDGQRQKITSFS